MTTQTPVKTGYDPRAKSVAEAVYAAVRPIAVILFGSRARGDYRDDSDVDLLVIVPDEGAEDWKESYMAACQSASAQSRAVYGDLLISVDVVRMAADRFADCRRAPNHVAGQAARDGVVVSQQPLPGGGQPPTNWPDIRQRFIAATRNLHGLDVSIEAASMPQEIIGFLGQQAVENALKGWISALDDRYGTTHNLSELAAIIRKHPAENDTPAGEALSWLTSYAVVYRYSEAKVQMDDPSVLYARVADLVDGVAARVQALTGRTPPRWAAPE